MLVPAYRYLRTQDLFDQAAAYWRGLAGRVRLDLPDRRWSEAFAAIAGHIAMTLNEGAPDVAVINYTTFNRDGMYNIEVLQQSGLFDWAAQAIDYLYAHPFNGRPYPEADNPGQILWVTAQHWRYTRTGRWGSARALGGRAGRLVQTPGRTDGRAVAHAFR